MWIAGRVINGRTDDEEGHGADQHAARQVGHDKIDAELLLRPRDGHHGEKHQNNGDGSELRPCHNSVVAGVEILRQVKLQDPTDFLGGREGQTPLAFHKPGEAGHRDTCLLAKLRETDSAFGDRRLELLDQAGLLPLSCLRHLLSLGKISSSAGRKIKCDHSG
jgi:hypothetical protein